MELIEEVEGKVVIWAHWRHDIATIVREIEKKEYPGSVMTYYGDTTLKIDRKQLKKCKIQKVKFDF